MSIRNLKSDSPWRGWRRGRALLCTVLAFKFLLFRVIILENWQEEQNKGRREKRGFVYILCWEGGASSETIAATGGCSRPLSSSRESPPPGLSVFVSPDSNPPTIALVGSRRLFPPRSPPPPRRAAKCPLPRAHYHSQGSASSLPLGALFPCLSTDEYH